MKTVRPSSHRAYPRRGFALVITLVMVALLAIITVGVFMSVSLERATAKSYNDRYQADLAVQNGLEAVKKTFGTSPSALPSPSPAPTPPPTPSPTAHPPPSRSAWNAARTQRLPTLYAWQQPIPSPSASPSPSGPSVQWVEMHDPQNASGPYTRYAYWAEDLDGY